MRQIRARSFRSAVACATFCVASVRVVAQPRVIRGVIDAVVMDSSLAPLEGAVGEILGWNGAVRTGRDGHFRFVALPPGKYALTVHRIGYSPSATFVVVNDTDTLRLSFILVAAPVSLETVSVNTSRITSGSTEFEYRRAAGFGQFMTESEIKKLNLPETSDLLRTFLSVAVGPAGVTNTRGFADRRCPMRLFVNGTPKAPRDLDSELPRPEQLVGIEVHANSATVPPQYGSFGGRGPQPGSAVCGVILLWTRE
jgi:hypothetical protein